MNGQRYCGNCGALRQAGEFHSPKSVRCRGCALISGHRYARGLKGESLTEKQARIAELICQGKSNREIAEALHRSPLTIKGHVEAILVKLDATDRTMAAAIYTEKKIKEAI